MIASEYSGYLAVVMHVSGVCVANGLYNNKSLGLHDRMASTLMAEYN